MATASGRGPCVTCGKEKSAFRCEGCSRIFCREHLNEHCQSLNELLSRIENDRDSFQERLMAQKNGF